MRGPKLLTTHTLTTHPLTTVPSQSTLLTPPPTTLPLHLTLPLFTKTGTSMRGPKLRIAKLNFLKAGEQLRLPDNSGRVGALGEVVLSVLAENGGRVLRIWRSQGTGVDPRNDFYATNTTNNTSNNHGHGVGVGAGVDVLGRWPPSVFS